MQPRYEKGLQTSVGCTWRGVAGHLWYVGCGMWYVVFGRKSYAARQRKFNLKVKHTVSTIALKEQLR